MLAIVERRRARRVPVAMRVALIDRAGGRPVCGVVRDASEVGLLIEMAEAPLQTCGERDGEIAFGSGPRTVRALEIRREACADGHLLVALELLGRPEAPEGGVAAPPEWPVRPASTTPPRCVVRGELRALGAAAFDQATRSPDAAVPAGLREWLDALAEQVGTTHQQPETATELVEAVRRLWDAT